MEEGIFGGKMELLKLSRLKLQLRALISEERERSTSEQLHLSIQKQKQSEEEFGTKLKELEAELASSIELRQKLERKVNYLQNDNLLLENKQKELNATVQGLLQSREHFVNAYEDSTCNLKRSIETRDRKLRVFSEKLSSHLLLFNSIEKEALSVKQVVDNVRHLICDKEELGMYLFSGLKRKLDRVSEVERTETQFRAIFPTGKISDMEIQFGKCKHEIKMKDRFISELEAKIEAENIVNKNRTQMEEISFPFVQLSSLWILSLLPVIGVRALSMKEAVIQNLISEKQVHSLHCLSLFLLNFLVSLSSCLNSMTLSSKIKQALDSEVKSLEAILKKIQHVFRDMSEDEKAFQFQVESKERSHMIQEVVDRIEDSGEDPERCSEPQPDVGSFPGCTGTTSLVSCP
ncbi:hypothetical protein Cgig2_013016 [Carnegiea gigantea]|uniref:Uncharacterized protein n=1 Tax=Carnegiea gigantea TaxID=171969 RepID=A0A9Q1JLH5_9CARY|nr:hypothetical protein Cgig2_013016 [Carnegiea gigantea]